MPPPPFNPSSPSWNSIASGANTSAQPTSNSSFAIDTPTRYGQSGLILPPDLLKEPLRPVQDMSASNNYQHRMAAGYDPMAALKSGQPNVLTATPASSASENLQRVTGQSPATTAAAAKSGPSKLTMTHAQANAALQNSGGAVPTVYLATYSNVPVYEITVRGIAVMRRRNDGWLNATSILKIAGIEKTKRTKILEKNILTREHEKIQGGYGKFQGTWIPLDRAQELAAEHNVAHILKPILEFDPSTAGQLPKLYQRRKPNPTVRNTSNAAINDGRRSGTPNSKTSYSPAPTPQTGGPSQQPRFLSLRPPKDAEQRDMTPALFMPPGGGGLLNAFGVDATAQAPQAIPPGSSNAEQDALRGYSSYGYAPQGVPLPESQGPSASPLNTKRTADQVDGDSSGSKRLRVTSLDQSGANGAVLLGPSPVKDLNALGPAGGSLRAASAPRSNRMSVGAPDLTGRDGSVPRYADRALPPKPYDEGEKRMRDHLVSLFAEEDLKPKGIPTQPNGSNSAAAAGAEGAPEAKLDNLLQELKERASLGGLGGGSEGPKASVDLVTDDHGHTALHWASALCRLLLVRTLVAKPSWQGGANIHAGNHAGETALHRSVLVTNSYDASSFPALLDLLSSSLNTRDFKKRTVLHHIALVAGLKGRAASARYYMACVLEHLANDKSGKYKGLIDAQDEDGETALGIVARLGNVSMIRMLLDVGARKDLPNALGIRPADWGIEAGEPSGSASALPLSTANELAAKAPHDIIAALGRPSQGPVLKSSDVREQLTSTLEELQGVFEQELKEKTDAVAIVQSHLQAATRDLASRRRNVSAAQGRVAEKDEVKQRVRNLKMAYADQLGEDAEFLDSMDEDYTKLHLSSLSEVPTSRRAVEELVRLRWLVQWYDTSCTTLSDHIAGLEGASAKKKMQCQQVVAMCANIPQDKVESMLDDLVTAMESDGHEVDLARVANFMQKVGKSEDVSTPPP